MKNKKLKDLNLHFEKMTISKLAHKYIQGGVAPIHKPDDIDYSCSCACGPLPDIIRY